MEPHKPTVEEVLEITNNHTETIDTNTQDIEDIILLLAEVLGTEEEIPEEEENLEEEQFMADISTVQVNGNTYNLVDPGAARSGHTHTFASSTHVHYMTSQNTITGAALGTPNTTYNTSDVAYFCA